MGLSGSLSFPFLLPPETYELLIFDAQVDFLGASSLAKTSAAASLMRSNQSRHVLGSPDTPKLKRMLITRFFDTPRVAPLPWIELYAQYYSSCELPKKKHFIL